MTAATSSLDVTVIIVSWNTRDILRDCLLSVYAQTCGIEVEVIIVDNESSDGSQDMIKKEFPQSILIENTENRGFAAANNQGIKIAGGRHILLLNPDTIVLDGAIQKCSQYADLHPEVAVVGCRAHWPDGRSQNTCFRYPSLFLVAWSSLLFFRMSKIFHHPFFHPERYEYLDFDLEHDVDVVAGCFFLVKREAVERAGVLDEDFFMYGEEAEWCYRITRSGCKVRYFPGATIIHIYGASSSQVEDDSALNKRKATLLVMHKTKGAFSAWLSNCLMLIGVLLRAPFWALLAFKKNVKQPESNIAGPFNAWNKYTSVIKFHLRGLFSFAWL